MNSVNQPGAYRPGLSFCFSPRAASRSANGLSKRSFTILTTDANDQIKPIHHRMPVIVQPEDYAIWLDPKTDAAKLRELLAPAPDGVLTAHRVSFKVNKPAFDAPECVEPFDAA